MADSTIIDNTATADGGGIYNDGTLTLTSSTISGNTADDDGGGIHNDGTLTVTSSTLNGNTAADDGGGIRNVDDTLLVVNSTITGNRADADGTTSGDGGGIGTSNPGAFTTIQNTIVAGNLKGAPLADAPHDLAEKDVEAGSNNNLIGDPGSAGGLVHGVDGNIVGDGLGGVLGILIVLDTTLADNGGPTLTHKLVIGSPAIEAGSNATAAGTTDQRGAGFARILDGDFDTTATVDIGAIEFTPPPDLPTIAPGTGALVADPLNAGKFVLLCHGTNGNDRIYLRFVSGGSARLQVGNQVIGTFSLANVARIVVLGKAGNDVIWLDRRIITDARLDGGPGNDRLTGGNGRNILIGGPGNDQMRGGKLRDLLIGGAGGDRLAGGLEDDLLIGGATFYDAIDAALNAMMNKWGDTAVAFADRVSALSSGTGVPVLDATTITSDAQRDSLGSDAGMQWIIHHLEDRISPSAVGDFLATLL